MSVTFEVLTQNAGRTVYYLEANGFRYEFCRNMQQPWNSGRAIYRVILEEGNLAYLLNLVEGLQHGAEDCIVEICP